MSESLDLEELNRQYKGRDPVPVMEWALKVFGSEIVLASSFGLEDVVLIHLASKVNRNVRIVTLDTGRLPEETHLVIDAIQMELGVKVETYFPDTQKVQDLVSRKGHYSFRESVENRKECCYIRKVEPLKRALKGSRAWFTGQRKSQSVTRHDLQKIEKDAAFEGIYKVNPLSEWTEDDVRNYIQANKVPYNKLFDLGYRSLGCAPCTRPVKEGEDERAGRWWWEDPEHKECGLHQS